MTLAAGSSTRPLHLDDAEDMADLISAYSLRLIGSVGRPLANIANQLRAPGFDPDLDSWAVHDEAGRLIGYSTTSKQGSGDRFNLDLVAETREAANWLLSKAMTRSEQLGREQGHAEITVGLGLLRADQTLLEVITEHGMTQSTTFQRLRIDHNDPVTAPTLPAGVAQSAGKEVSRAAHQIMVETFEGQDGATPLPYDEWVASREKRTTFDWSLLTVLELDGLAVAALECGDDFLASDNCGYVARIGVLPEARGRGLARYLLQNAFAIDAAAGRAGTILHVDSANPTPALGLYLGVGMRSILVIDVWSRVVSTG
ncbi:MULTISPECIES: N-acetyltransferase [Kribbella]|uniref:GNAT family N-acetyltransferase n=1 Tax=Kribbella TaxID=182639 RepID=UPI001050364C|nr:MULTISPECIES: GNAT family N-acetyltransferase [Kribbella]